MKKTKIILLAVIGLIIIGTLIYFLVGFLGKKQLSKISDEAVKHPYYYQEALYFIGEDDKTVNRYNFAEGSSEEIINFADEIRYFLPAPDFSKAVIQTFSDGYSSFLLDFGEKKMEKLDDCTATVGWKADASGFYYNCFSQDGEYDPGTVNNLSFYFIKSRQSGVIADLLEEIDPPKLLEDKGENILILTDNSGYGSNDILSLNLKTKKLSNLTNDGFAREMTAVPGRNSFVYSTGDPPLALYIFDAENNQKRLLGKSAAALDGAGISSDGNNLYAAIGSEIVEIDLVSGKSKGWKIALPKEATIMKVLSAEGRGVIVATDKGIFSLAI